jgi:UDP-3-O-[3-hydroxymyristoyl] glucosamine N-acyltransferase
VILIGDGGHARDIAETLDDFRLCKHSDDFEGYGPYIIGINDPNVRAKLAAGYGWDDEPWIHPTVFMGPGCAVGKGTHVNYAVSMTRTKIGRHCTISPGATICGDVTIGDRVFIGAGAVIRNLVTIGEGAFVCMGASVTRDVAPGEKYR